MMKILHLIAQTNATEVKKPKVYVGIDLGTTFSCVGIYQQDKSFEYLSFGGETPDTIPSVVHVEKKKVNGAAKISVGYDAQARNQVTKTSDNFFFGFKRLMGLLADHDEVSGFKKSVTYNVESKSKGGKSINVFPVKYEDGTTDDFTPTGLSAMLLNKMREMVEAKYEILTTVVTTPSYFTVDQEEETRQAAEYAGFKNVKISKEPTAACVEYAQTANLKLDTEEPVLVFDLGGGTFDLSLVEIENDQDEGEGQTNSNITVSKYGGDNFLGGENVNDELFNHFKKQIAHELTQDEALTLRLIIEKFKIDSCNRWTKEKDAVMKETYFDSNKKRYDFTMTQKEFNALCAPVFKKVDDLLFSPDKGMFRPESTNRNKFDKPVKIESIKKIVLVGGSTRIPYIKEYLMNKFKGVQIYDSIDPDKSVAAGAARLAMNMDSTSGDNSIMLLNVTTLPIGICVSDGSFKPILNKDEVIPIDHEEVFTTVQDNQRKITLQVATGMRTLFKHNHNIGEFEFELDEIAPKGVPQIAVKCHMDADYKLTVTARDMKTNKEKNVTFNKEYVGTDKNFVKKILEEAKAHEAEDQELKAVLELKRTFEKGLEEYEAQTKSDAFKNLDDKQKLVFETTHQTYKSWYDENKETVKSEELKNQTDNLVNSAKELADAIKVAPQQKKEEEKGKDVL